MSPSALSRFRAERLLRKEFSALRSKVLAVVRSQLRGKGIALDPADLEACYSQAWQGLYTTVLGGEQVENPSAWLVTVTFRRAIDEARSASRGQHDGMRVALVANPTGDAPGAPAFDPDIAGALDDRARLRQVFESLRTSLSPRECEAASLCYLQGLSRAEAAERMGVSQARMGKLMEGAGSGSPGVAGKVGSLLDTIKAGGWCEQQSSLMRAFAFGILDPEGERHALALSHCRECPACRAHVASLRGLASVLPPALLAPTALAGGSGAGAGVAPGVTSGTQRLASALRIGGRSGWGLGGSPAAKLAVTALVVLGAGYTLLGSRAHGSLPARHSTLSPASAASPQLLQSPPTVQSGKARSARRSVSHLRRAHASHSAKPATDVRPTAPEFGPERVPAEVGSPAHSPSPVAGEFGIE